MDLKPYFFNCFLLMVPVMAWNIFMAGELPHAFQLETFQRDVPLYIVYGENFFRLVLFVLAYLMPLPIKSGKQKTGLVIYVAGTVLYFCSWLVLIYLPDIRWSKSIFGFMAPAYTPIFWLTGIMLIGDRFSFGLRYRAWYFISASLLLLVFHNLHTLIIFTRMQ